MARFRPNADEGIQITLTRRRIWLAFLVALVVVGASFTLGLLLGRGQRRVEQELVQTEPPSVVIEPGPAPTPATSQTEPPVIPIEPEPTPPPEPAAPSEPANQTTREVPLHPETAPPPPAPESPPPPSPAPSASESAPAQPSGGPSRPRTGYVVQVVAIRDAARARAIAQQLQQAQLPAFVEPGPRGLVRVQVGPYSTRTEAEQVIPQIVRIVPKTKPFVKRLP